MYVESQMQGGVAQGVGWAFNEEYLYDENGRPACGKRPTAVRPASSATLGHPPASLQRTGHERP